MNFMVTMKPLVRTGSERGRRAGGARLLAASAIVALGMFVAPVASAQFSYCLIQGPSNAECGTQATFVATSPFLPGSPFSAAWSLTNNSAGAFFAGANSCTGVTSCSVVVNTSQVGSVVVHVILSLPGGIQKTCQHSLTVADTTPPTITCPPNVNVECNTSIDPSVTGVPLASDTCGPVTVNHTDTIVDVNCAGPIIARTWTAFDSHGHSASCVQTITTVSTPSITCPGPVSVQCFSLVPPPNIGSATASDSCGGAVTVTHEGDSASNGQSSCNNVITRTYKVVNSCGNQATCTQTITVNDTTPPSITCPGPVSVECFALVPAPSTTSVTASDNCGDTVTVVFVGDSASNGQSNCNNVITRTYSATDSCGNQATCTQTITVNDTTPPSFQFCAPPVIVQCFSQVPAPNTTLAPAFDNCNGPVTVTFIGDSASNGQSNCSNTITRTYRATDSCGNHSDCFQTIIVNDTTPPSITCPAPVSVQCFSLVPVPNIGSASTSDNCGGAVTVTHLGDSASNGQSSCNNVITRTYQATDSCGNQATCTQTITVNDTTPPLIQCPGPVSVQCFSLVPPPSITAVAASDNCGGAVTVTHVGDSASNGQSSCNNVITRTYQAVDSCGNQATCTQTITVNDTTPPLIQCPGPVSVQCFSLVPPPSITSVAASDNCGGAVTVTHVGDSASNGTSNCDNVITRTYQTVDPCGNQATCTQTITVNDTTAPSITCPAPVTVECFSMVPLPDIGLVTASDNCGGSPTVTFVGDLASNGTSNCNVITRTYRATDSCGNQSDCTQTITVSDTTPPSITCPPNFTLPCGTPTDPTVTGSASAIDNCDPNPLIAFTDVQTGVCSPTSSETITRTWTATDSCNNSASCVQIITLSPPPPDVPGCVRGLGGGCGAPAPQLFGSLLPGPTVSFFIDLAPSNAPGLLAAQLPPFGPDMPLATPCVLHLDPGGPTTLIVDSFQTDAMGMWSMSYLVPMIPLPIDIRVQAAILSPGGPLGFAQLTNGVEIVVGPDVCPPCTLSRAQWAASIGPSAMLYDLNWLTVFPAGMDIGIYNPGNGNTAPNGIRWTGTVAGRTSLKTCLGTFAGVPSPLPQDVVNATSTSSGVLGRLTAVLQLNISFNAAGLLGFPTPGFGSMTYNNPGDALDGYSVNQILGVCNQVLANGVPALPPGYTFLILAGLLEDLSLAFEDCTPSPWAGKHLGPSPK